MTVPLKDCCNGALNLHAFTGCQSIFWLSADGQKIFQSEFIGIIHPGANLIGQLEYNLLNSSVALFGYYLAAATIDRPWMGRRRMQARTCMQPLLGSFLSMEGAPSSSVGYSAARSVSSKSLPLGQQQHARQTRRE